ncbi:MAG: hypothetical protein HGB29_03150, partial [Chlorobiaceae bacterium]|nr:hypothetical protein [Chlorobiaceae bacterium]
MPVSSPESREPTLKEPTMKKTSMIRNISRIVPFLIAFVMLGGCGYN